MLNHLFKGQLVEMRGWFFGGVHGRSGIEGQSSYRLPIYFQEQVRWDPKW
jgi:hypothetical protein